MKTVTTIIPDSTVVKVTASDSEFYGIIGENDVANSEENLLDLNYCVIPNGQRWNDEIMIYWESVKEIKTPHELGINSCVHCGNDFKEGYKISYDVNNDLNTDDYYWIYVECNCGEKQYIPTI